MHQVEEDLRNLQNQLEASRKKVKGLEQGKSFKQKIDAKLEVEKRNLWVLLAGADHPGTSSSSGLKLKPLNTIVQKEVKAVQPGGDVSGQMASSPSVDKVIQQTSKWTITKLVDFLKNNRKTKWFWESSFVLLVMSGVEMETITVENAASSLGVGTQAMENQLTRLRSVEKAFDQESSISKIPKKSLAKIKSEACVRELGDCADSFAARGVKRKAYSWDFWITGEVVAHLLKRSFLLKDQIFPRESQGAPDLVLMACLPFYEGNVMRVVKEIEECYGFQLLLMESREVQDLLKAARNLDRQKMEEGGYDLAPAYNFSRCTLEQKADYWETGLPALLLRDVRKGVMYVEVAACQLGVTTTMILSVLARKRLRAAGFNQEAQSGQITVRKYKEFGFGSEEDFWKEDTTVEVLEKVCRTSILIRKGGGIV